MERLDDGNNINEGPSGPSLEGQGSVWLRIITKSDKSSAGR